MGIIKNTLKTQITDNNTKQYNDISGIILDYDKLTSTATIRYPNPYGEGYLYRSNVSIASTLGGFTSDGIKPGLECSITFINNNIHAPMVTGILAQAYNLKTNTDQGAYLVDRTVVFDEDIPTEITPMSKQWIDEKCEVEKYNTEIHDYTDTDISQTVFELLDSLDKYKDNENGITNLDSKSNIKTRDNGDIEIFVSNTVGVRISTKDHRIYFYGKGIYLNDKELKFGDVMCYNNNTDNSNTDDNIEDDELIKAFEKALALMEADVEELKRCITYLKQITGSLTKYKTLEQKIKQYENIRDSYEPGVTTIDTIKWMNNVIQSLKPLFAKELKDAQGVLNAIMK